MKYLSNQFDQPGFVHYEYYYHYGDIYTKIKNYEKEIIDGFDRSKYLNDKLDEYYEDLKKSIIEESNNQKKESK